ncbi:MAG TPA: bifunctional oligoribonuclease/PAP phosphatase NrnA [bacterium]|nr:bifunctional oligoribonuclease/PAP phosphatase NrnA [bacterium]
MWDRIASILRENHCFLITSHIRPDGDAVGSCLALRRILVEMGKTVRWVMNHVPPQEFSFLYQPEELEIFDQSMDLEGIDCICALDVSDWRRTGDLAEPLQALTVDKICLDHHPCGGFLVEAEIRDEHASATAVLVHRLLQHLNHPLSFPVAEAIYTGVMTDTMYFHLANTNAEAHEVASACLEAGVSAPRIYEYIYGTSSVARLKLAAKVLSTLLLAGDGRVAYVYATREMYDTAGAVRGDDEDFVEYPRSLAGVEIAIFLRETDVGTVRVSWRARNDMDVSLSARHFGGGGHVRAAGAELNVPLDTALKEVIADAVARVTHADSSSAARSGIDRP